MYKVEVDRYECELISKALVLYNESHLRETAQEAYNELHSNMTIGEMIIVLEVYKRENDLEYLWKRFDNAEQLGEKHV